MKPFCLGVVVQLGAGIGVGDGNLNGFDVEFLGEIDGAANGFFRLTGKAEDEIAVNRRVRVSCNPW